MLTVKTLSSQNAEQIAVLNSKLIVEEGSNNKMTHSELVSRMSQWLNNDYRCIGVMNHLELVAYCLLTERTNDIYIRQLYVSDQWRKQGLGSKLIKQVQLTSDKPIALEVLATNPNALRFYQSIGFQPYSTLLKRHEV